MPLSAGTRLGPYEIVAPIGAGGMGEVYRAHDPRLRRDVAIKVLPSALSSDADRLRRFEQEANAAAALNHPNILIIYDIGHERPREEITYVVSELLEGSTLREVLANGALSVRKAIDYAIQLSSGLAAAHEKGIVHRDLKPENLFVTRDKRVKILDFGLAKLTEAAVGAGPSLPVTRTADTTPGIVLGTIGYMSPEQVRGQAIDYRCDIFSFGAVLYEMLSGKRAFTRDTPADTMSAILNAEPPELTETNRTIPAGLERFVRHCLEKSPTDRFQSVRDMAFDLDALSGLSGTTTEAMASGQPGRPWRSPVVVFILTGVLAIAAIVTLLVALRSRNAPAPDYHQITFRRGRIESARFAPDGTTIVYAAAWEGRPSELFSARISSRGERALQIPEAEILAISSAGEMALLVGPGATIQSASRRGTLARAPLNGGAPREIMQNVGDADWSSSGNELAISRYAPGPRRWRLEYPPGKVLYETDRGISHIRLSPTGDRVAFLEHSRNNDDRGFVAVVDLTGQKKILTPEFPSVQGTAWSGSGEEIWFTAAGPNRTDSQRGLFGVSLAGKVRPIALVPGSLILEDVSRDGRLLLSAEVLKVRLMVQAPGETAERDLSWLDASRLQDISADGKTILFHEAGGGGGPNYSVFLRRTDGTPAVRLGEGAADQLSPDGKWAVSRSVVAGPPRIVLLPVGPGEPRTIESALDPYWFPDSRRLLLCGAEPGKQASCWVYDLESGRSRPITPEGVVSGPPRPISPDGKWILVVRNQDRQWWLWPVEGGEPRRVTGLGPDDFPYQWVGDGKAVYVRSDRRDDILPRKIFTLDLATGRKQFLRSFGPSDFAGISGIQPPLFSRDGQAYAYGYRQILSDLYVADAIK
jgi:Tol biopolymer transport system component